MAFIILDPCYDLARERAVSFAAAQYLPLYGVALRPVQGVAQYVAVFGAVVGHPLLCPINPAPGLGEILAGELGFYDADGEYYMVDHRIVPDGQYWFVRWQRMLWLPEASSTAATTDGDDLASLLLG